MVSQTFHREFPLISTTHDQAPAGLHSLLHSASIRSALLRLLPSDFFFEGKEEVAEELHKMLPIIQSNHWGEEPCHVSIFLLCRHRVNAMKFFYEMINHWLLPGRRLTISSFFGTDFKLPELSEELLNICEIVISVEHEYEVEMIRQNLPILEAEIRFGLISVYHASRILEIKGLSADQKTALIQERIASLLEKRPSDFDYDIFSQMQHFLVMCGEEFKAAREYGHMSRIIYVFYLFRKSLKQQIETNPGQRYLNIKFSKAQLNLPFGTKRVLGIFISINLLNDNEVFEERHVMKALRSCFPSTVAVEGSYFASSLKEENIHQIYLEVEKGEGGDFSLSEIALMKQRLPNDLKNGIEKLMRPVFMPRNEEEVMRNIITLSNQLKYPRDFPQVIISFDEQTDLELSFTIILLRVLQKSSVSIQEMIQKTPTILKFIPDRVKIVGMLRKKYPKEASVFRLKIPTSSFLRQDHSVDLLKARQKVILELQRIIGEVRDFNGGMISKQQEQFTALKNSFTSLEKREEVLLENFFHSIFPIELRSLVPPFILKNLFSVLVESLEEDKDLPYLKIQQEGECLYLLLKYNDLILKEKVVSAVGLLRYSSSQLVSLSLQVVDAFYLGFILQNEDGEARKLLINAVKSAICS